MQSYSKNATNSMKYLSQAISTKNLQDAFSQKYSKNQYIRKQTQNAANSNKRIYSSFQLFPKNVLEKQNIYAGTFLPKSKKGAILPSASSSFDFNVIIRDTE